VRLKAEDRRVDTGQLPSDPQGTVAQRVFKPDESRVFSYVVMNPKIESASKLPRLEARRCSLGTAGRSTRARTAAQAIDFQLAR
jgi:hypothetical protein